MDHACDGTPAPDALRAILANLSREIREPLDQLLSGVVDLIDSGASAMTEVDAHHAETMRTLCEDLARLTSQRLGDPAVGE